MRQAVPTVEQPVPRSIAPRLMLRSVAAAFAVAVVVALTVVLPTLNLADARAYYDARMPDPYADARLGGAGAYLYAPAFAQFLSPLTALSWPAFAFVWLVGSAAALVILTGPAAALVALIPPVLMELQVGNIHLLLAIAIAVGLRWPASWAFVLLTKPTLGIGLLWFLVRREWRSLAIAGVATALVASMSVLLAPSAWASWVDVLIANAGRGLPPDYDGVIHVPLLVRLVVAAAMVIWGALTDRRWTIAVAATLALPVLWVNGLVILLAIPMLEGWTWAGLSSWWRRRRQGQAPASG